MNPLKVKATGSPITSANISGLQTMTDAEVKNYIANVITEKFAAVTDGTGTAELNITTNNSGAGTSIGTFVDTTRTESIGTHPATGAVSTTTYYVKQVTAAATENITNRPLAWDSRLEEMTDGDIDSTMDLCVEAMVAESSYTAGQYKLQATAPSGGTWVARYTLTDTAQGGNTVTYLWQKTVASSAPTVDYTPLKVFDGGNCKQMTEAEIEQMLPVFRNRIIETGIGTYKIQTDAPSGGTWIQTGNTFTDTREEVTPQNYAGNFTGNFTGNFSGNYGGTANYSGSRTYSGNYEGNYGGTLFFSGSRTYSRFIPDGYMGFVTFSGNYGGFRNYSGNYVGNYGGSILVITQALETILVHRTMLATTSELEILLDRKITVGLEPILATTSELVTLLEQHLILDLEPIQVTISELVTLLEQHLILEIETMLVTIFRHHQHMVESTLVRETMQDFMQVHPQIILGSSWQKLIQEGHILDQ
jgi:hypothetical protein